MFNLHYSAAHRFPLDTTIFLQQLSTKIRDIGARGHTSPTPSPSLPPSLIHDPPQSDTGGRGIVDRGRGGVNSFSSQVAFSFSRQAFRLAIHCPANSAATAMSSTKKSEKPCAVVSATVRQLRQRGLSPHNMGGRDKK